MNSLPLLIATLATGAALLGSLGGIGGATLLVPVLVAIGTEPTAAAPIGLATVAAGSLAASSRQLAEGTVHHRLGITVELAAAVGAVTGALLSLDVPERLIAWVLAAAAAIGGVAALARRGVRNRPLGILHAEPAGEWPGTLGGQYRNGDEIVPYHATHLERGLPAALLAGVVAGLSGVGGGFLKTPAMSELMHVPVKVAAATTTFTLGITASAGLLVYAVQGRIEPVELAGAIAGAVLGGWLGARLQQSLAPTAVRRATGVLLLVVAVVVAVRA